jgi:TetR/AcrR family transcriptional regulator, fatty acid biosynthesis regulator
MSLRAEQKEQTKRTIMKAALTSLSADRSYGSLSLREVARVAQIAPTSFYRHFKDLEDLGVSLAQEVGETLMELVRQGAREVGPERDLIRASTDIFLRYLREEPHQFRFLMREKSGSSPKIRAEIKRLTEMFIDQIADFIVKEASRRARPIAEPRILAQAIVNIALYAGVEFLDAEPWDQEVIYQQFIKQIMLVSLGGEALARHREQKALRQ